MNEPSKWAIAAVTFFHNGTTPLINLIQDAIDAALAEKDKEIGKLREEIYSMEKWRDKRISELEAEVKGWSDANKAQSPVHLRVVTELQSTRQRLASLQALMERVGHDGNEAGCFKNCPRCAYERWKEGEK
jgi:hypothetical protein